MLSDSSSRNTAPGNTDEPKPPPDFKSECDRATKRRTLFGVARPPFHKDVQWALAFSGGGIRSATFCLGVLQGLAKSEQPPLQQEDRPIPPQSSRDSLLTQFDYLSTVSGGGYIGSFFGSLFVNKRLNTSDALTDEQTAAQAYKVFEEEPPGRLRGSVVFDKDTPGKAPLAWLRENGRYMAPTGAGDMVYAVALTIRNWFATHYVLGTVLLTAFVLLGLARAALVQWSFDYSRLGFYGEHEMLLLWAVLNQTALIWWSPIWWLVVPVLALWLIPCGLAFWLTHPGPGRGVSDKPDVLSIAMLCALVVGAGLTALATWRLYYIGPEWIRIVAALDVAGIITILGCLWHGCTAYGSDTIGAQRVTLTRGLARGFLWLAAIVLLAVVDTSAQSLYVNLGHIKAWLTPTVATGALVWLVRQLAASFNEKEREGWLSKIPFNLIVTVAGIALLFLVALFWAMLAQWIQWRGYPPALDLLSYTGKHGQVLMALAVASALAIILALISGQFPGFLNLSTLQGLYGARLTRAYLGGSNGRRFAAGSGNLRSVAEPVASDHLTPETYYRNPLMPIHIINVCVNQNIDPDEQLVQRDRKGKPLAIVPNGFALDGWFSAFPASGGKGELEAALTIGEWVGVSGAAFSTGLGRGTTLGYSLLMGLANVRLGRWWQSGMMSSSAPARGHFVGKLARKLFETQAYLFDELFATFYGTRRPLQYLSDGGHFENTAVYELLRKERNIRLIVVCDCGCDPKYEFEDLANLVRLARIDFGVEIEVDRSVAEDDHLKTVFGKPEDFLPHKDGVAPGDTKCALLLNVYHTPESRTANRPDAHIIVLKPRLISGAAVDLLQYHSTRPAFPQEPTADQFYDEAQWESYRRLGLEIATRVFGVGNSQGDYYRALWGRVLR